MNARVVGLTTVVVIAGGLARSPGLADPPRLAGGRLVVEVRETAGIRRFGYPVSATLRLEPPAPAGSRWRLTQGEAAVAAQFRIVEEKGGGAAEVALDFEGNFLPGERRDYAVEYGPETTPGQEPESGLSLEEKGDVHLLANGAHLAWEFPRDLRGLLRSVRTSREEFLQASSPGLYLRGRDGALHRLPAAPPARVVKRGPLSCRLRWEQELDLGGPGRTRSRVEVEVPRSKSWMRLDWTLDDPGGAIDGCGAELRLQIAEGEALADFGAAGLVYATLGKGQAAQLRAGLHHRGRLRDGDPRWEVRRGPAGAEEPYVVGIPGDAAGPPDGWAHLMDRKRCTAVAVADFARASEDTLALDAAGTLRIERRLPAAGTPAGPRALTFWVHFVDFPPHVGAVTSPQSMAAPLQVRVSRAAGE